MRSAETVTRIGRYLESNPALVVILDRQGRIVELNPAGAELLGVTATEATGSDWFRFVPPEQLAEVRRVFAGVMAGGEASFGSYENDLVTARGERRTLLWRNALLRDDAGAIVGGISTGVDITVRKALEAQLAASEARHRDLVEHMSEGVAVHEIVLDAVGRPVDYRFLQVNSAFERLTGLRAADVVGRRVLEVIPDLEPAFIERYGRVALTGEPVSFEQRAVQLGRVYQVSAYRPTPGQFACTFTDVTEQRRTVAALHAAAERAEASERSLRLVAEQSRDVIWTYDLEDRRFTYVSPSVRALRGLTQEEALAEPLEASLTPESLERARTVLARIGTAGEEDTQVAVYDQPCKDGSIKHVEMTSSYLRDAAGRPVAVLGVSRDATDRVRAERALRQSESLYRSLFNAVPAGVLLSDQGGRVLAFNDRTAEQLGYTREAFERLAIWEIDTTEDRAQVLERTRRVLEHGRVEFDTVHRARDGSTRDVHVRVVRVELGEAPALLSVWDDLTEPRRLERELRLRLEERDERERWLQASQRVARLGHYVFDVAGDRWTGSPTLDELFGIGPDYVRDAAGWLGLVHPDDRDSMGAYLHAFLAGGTTFDRVYRVGKAGDPPRWVQGLGSLERDAAGRPLRMIGTIQDITARHLAEQAREALAAQLRQSQKLESIGRLAGGVAHDFNNILVVLLGCAEALRLSVAEGRPPDAEDVEELQAAARRAKELTSQLLAFARKQVVEPVTLDLNAQVRQADRLLRRLIGEDVRLSLRLQPGLWTATCDPGQLQQVLVNLAVNARDAMPGGGEITISTTNVEAPEAAEDGWHGTGVPPGPLVRLLVEDTGAGVPPELGPTIFEPFVTTKPAGKGTGLGLATVYGIVQQAGGALRFRSSPGRGSAFEVLLPRAAGQVAAAAAPPPTPPATTAVSGEQILLVEDDALVRTTTSRALRQAGYQVAAAADGAEALALLQRDGLAPRLLLTDVVMPGLNGRQVAEEVQRQRPNIRVLFMSGYANDIIVHHGVVDPGIELLEKPFTSDSLLQRVRATLDR